MVCLFVTWRSDTAGKNSVSEAQAMPALTEVCEAWVKWLERSTLILNRICLHPLTVLTFVAVVSKCWSIRHFRCRRGRGRGNLGETDQGASTKYGAGDPMRRAESDLRTAPLRVCRS